MKTLMKKHITKPVQKLSLLLVSLSGLSLGFSTSLQAEIFVETITQLSARDAVLIDGDQLYASNYNTGAVYAIELDGTVTRVLENNNRGPAGMRTDDDGNLYIALYNSGQIIRIDSQGNETIFAPGVREPIALDWDDAGNLYVSHFAGPDTVTRISPDGTQTSLAPVPALSLVSSLCLDSAGDVYVTSYSSPDIYRITPAGQVSLFATSDAPGYSFLQYDAVNNVFYAAITQTNRLMRFQSDGTPEVLINSPGGGAVDGPVDIASVDSAIGVAVSDDGKHVYFATDTHIRRLNLGDPAVDQIRPYFTSDTDLEAEEGTDFTHQFVFADPNNDVLVLTIDNLPAWLTFDGDSTISGVPGADDVDRAFSVTGQLTDGIETVSQTVGISVSASTTSNPPDPAPTPAPAPTPDPGSSSSGGAMGVPLALLLLGFTLVRRGCLAAATKGFVTKI